MIQVRLTSWEVGLRKISLTKLLQERAGLGLAEAKCLVDHLLDGKEAVVNMGSSEDAERLVSEIRALGASCIIDSYSDNK